MTVFFITLLFALIIYITISASNEFSNLYKKIITLVDMIDELQIEIRRVRTYSSDKINNEGQQLTKRILTLEERGEKQRSAILQLGKINGYEYQPKTTIDAQFVKINKKDNK